MHYLVNLINASPDPDPDPDPNPDPNLGGGDQLPNPNEYNSTLTSGTNNIYPYPYPYIDVNDRGHRFRSVSLRTNYLTPSPTVWDFWDEVFPLVVRIPDVGIS